uniref:Cadherin domain-containing protein n=1 Tax=Knipowitschia caucasica TaxID=637954 RepID=A0AAV2KU25_KNICA
MIDTYNISGCAVTKNGETIEDILHLQFKVVDENDNAPTFPSVIEPGEVLEHSPAGTEVMTVTATDLDEPGNPNSQMVYIDSSGSPMDVFSPRRPGDVQMLEYCRGRRMVTGETKLKKFCCTVPQGQAVAADVRGRRHWDRSRLVRLRENVDYTRMDYIGWIMSDRKFTPDVQYFLEGIGVNLAPFNVFVVDSQTGFIKVTKILDREQIDIYNLSGFLKNIHGQLLEERVDLQIKVLDGNDNAPTFPSVIEPGEVFEHSPAGTEVMTVTATDLDEPGNPNSQMVYSLLKQQPPSDMFYMKPNGTIYVKRDIPDRETMDHYVLTVQAQDLNGDPSGLTGTSAVTVNVQDIHESEQGQKNMTKDAEVLGRA